MSDSGRDQLLSRARTLLYSIAILCAIFGVIAIGPLTVLLLTRRTRPRPGQIVYFGLMTASFAAPMVLYLYVAANLRLRKTWPLILGIVVASVHTVAALLVLGFVAWAIRFVGPVLLIPATTAIVTGSLAGMIVRQLARLFATLHELSPAETAGFSPIMRSKDSA